MHIERRRRRLQRGEAVMVVERMKKRQMKRVSDAALISDKTDAPLQVSSAV